MSAALTLHGIIVSPMSDPAVNPWRHHEANRRIISELPTDIVFPEIHPDMFGFATEDTRFRDECIHFGAIYKQYEDRWPDWLANFEALLAKLYWTDASVTVDFEMIGTYMYRYRADHASLIKTVFSDNPTPPTSWVLTGGPRDILEGGQKQFEKHSAFVDKYFKQNTWRYENGILNKLEQE